MYGPRLRLIETELSVEQILEFLKPKLLGGMISAVGVRSSKECIEMLQKKHGEDINTFFVNTEDKFLKKMLLVVALRD